MSVPGLLGVSPAVLGVALAVAWVVVICVALYRYRYRGRSRGHLYTAVSMGGFWLAYSLLQVAAAVDGALETALVGAAFGLFGTGVGAGVRWWRVRNDGTDTQTKT